MSAAVIADESTFGRYIAAAAAASIFDGKKLFVSDAQAADKRCRSIIDNVRGSRAPNVGASGINGDGG